MNLSLLRIYSLTLIIILLAACAADPPPPAEVEVVPAATEEATVETVAEAEPVVTDTPVPVPTDAPTQTPEPTATGTPVATVTPTTLPTDTPSPSPEPQPLIRVDPASENSINVRSGPGTGYPVLVVFEPGQEANVIGRNEGATWWQINLPGDGEARAGWIIADLVAFEGDEAGIAIAEAPPLPTPAPTAVAATEPGAPPADEAEPAAESSEEAPPSSVELAEQLRCGKDFCVTFQALVPMAENGGCVGNHSIYITVLEGLPPGRPLDGIVIGDTFNNVEVASGSNGPGRTEITLWNNSMTLVAKRHMNGTPYTSEESFNFTSHDELIPAEVLAAAGYCEGRVETCRVAQQNNQVCRGHYSWRVTFHKFD